MSDCGPHRQLLIGCRVFERELDAPLRAVTVPTEVIYLSMGVHARTGESAREAIQSQVDAAESARYDRILIGYGLCNYGIIGLRARSHELIVPRTHDCIGFLLGSRERYVADLQSRPDAYYLTSGWVDARREERALAVGPAPATLGLSRSLEDLITKYGEDNGRYLHAMLHPAPSQYVYVTSGCMEEASLIAEASRDAQREGVPLNVTDGTARLVRQLVVGPWPAADFLRVPPGGCVRLSHDERLIAASESES